MTLMLDLPPELEARLQDEAARRGMEVEEWALQILRSGMQNDPEFIVQMELAQQAMQEDREALKKLAG
jgi:hypothetical protein